MALFVNGSETENMYVGGEKMERVFANGTLVYEATIYVAKPTVSGSLTYNGSAQKPTITGYDSVAMTVSGTQSATNAGTYTIKFTLNKGYAWKDGTTDALSFTWSIAKKSVTKPALSGSYTYNGKNQAVTINNYDSAAMTISGTQSAANAGTYTIKFTLNKNYVWADGSTGDLTLTWSIARKSVAKTAISGSYTYNGSLQTVVIKNYDSAVMTLSGTQTAGDAGTYHVYCELRPNYQWADGTTAKLDLTWTIAKKSITIPSLSTTSFAWIEGDSHSVTVKNLDTNYVTQSGETSVVDSADTVGKHTVTWTLKNTTSTQWTDGTTAAKSATWLTAFVVGTSHWKNDLYNQGWCAGNFASYWADIDMGSASQPYITVKKNTEGKVGVLYYNESRSSILPLHMTVKASSSDTAWTRLACVKSGGSSLYAYKPADTAQTYNLGTSWTTLYGTSSSVSGNHYPGIVFSGNPTHYIMRIWHD